MPGNLGSKVRMSREQDGYKILLCVFGTKEIYSAPVRVFEVTLRKSGLFWF